MPWDRRRFARDSRPLVAGMADARVTGCCPDLRYRWRSCCSLRRARVMARAPHRTAPPTDARRLRASMAARAAAARPEARQARAGPVGARRARAAPPTAVGGRVPPPSCACIRAAVARRPSASRCPTVDHVQQDGMPDSHARTSDTSAPPVIRLPARRSRQRFASSSQQAAQRTRRAHASRRTSARAAGRAASSVEEKSFARRRDRQVGGERQRW